MSTRLTVPTVFTAVDRLTSVVSRMGRSVTNFADRTQASVSRANRWFNKLTPSLSSAQKHLLDMASTATIVAGIVGGIVFSGKSIADYEDRVAAFRSVVSDLDDKAFKPYQKMINQVAVDTKTSAIDVARSFETITGLNAQLATTAAGLGAVSKASIVLSKASRLDLATSSEALVGILSQFSLEATQADRVINVLAAGLKYGSASIENQTESYKNYGTVAKTANVTLEQSVGLIQTLAKYQIKGAEAGTALRGVTVRLQKANLGYKSGIFNMNDAIDEARMKLSKLGSQQQKDATLIKLFGLENITAGKILLNNTELTRQLTKQVTGTGEAHLQAAINTDTLNAKMDQLKNTWINYITSNEKANTGLIKVKNAIGFVTDNIDTLVTIGANVLLFFGAWKALIWSTQIALGAYNIVLGVTGALSGIASVAIGKSSIALAAYNVASWLATAGATAFAVAVNLGLWPILAIGAGIALVISYLASLYRNWEMIKTSFKEKGFFSGILAIGKALLDGILAPLESILNLIAKIPGMSWASSAAAGLHSFRQDMGVDTGDDPDKPAPVALGTPQQKQTEVTNNNNTKNTLDVNINDPGKSVKSATMKGSLNVPINLTSTQGVR